MPQLLTFSALIFSACALSAASAWALDCRTGARDNQLHARNIVHSLRYLDALTREVQRLEAHSAAVYVDLDDPLRGTVQLMGGTHFASLGGQCHRPARLDLSAAESQVGAVGAITHVPSSLRLSVFATGRGDILRLDAPQDPEGGTVLIQYRGLLGARLQVTPWLEVGLARVGTDRDEGDVPALRGFFDDAPPDPTWLYEVSVPKLGLTLRVTDEGDELFVREAAVRAVPITDHVHVSAKIASLATEDRWVVTPLVDYAVVRSQSALQVGLSVWAEAAFESDAFGLRHARLGVRAPMISSSVKRGGWSQIGLNIEQRAALSVHRGAVMRAASDQRAAVGGEYLVDFEMRTPYITVGFDFGLAFNRPETLDLFPGLGNSLSLIVAMGLGSHF